MSASRFEPRNCRPHLNGLGLTLLISDWFPATSELGCALTLHCQPNPEREQPSNSGSRAKRTVLTDRICHWFISNMLDNTRTTPINSGCTRNRKAYRQVQ